MIHLAPLRRKDFARVAHIKVAPDQIKYAGTVRTAFATREAGVDFHAIYLEKAAIGFFKIDRAYAVRYAFCHRGELGLRAFIIDLSHQGQGLGSAAARALADYVPCLYSEAPSIALTVNHGNPAAKAAYLKGGFIDTGEIYAFGPAGPQSILRMTFT